MCVQTCWRLQTCRRRNITGTTWRTPNWKHGEMPFFLCSLNSRKNKGNNFLLFFEKGDLKTRRTMGIKTTTTRQTCILCFLFWRILNSSKKHQPNTPYFYKILKNCFFFNLKVVLENIAKSTVSHGHFNNSLGHCGIVFYHQQFCTYYCQNKLMKKPFYISFLTIKKVSS